MVLRYFAPAKIVILYEINNLFTKNNKIYTESRAALPHPGSPNIRSLKRDFSFLLSKEFRSLGVFSLALAPRLLSSLTP
jgi:hypothetical protein